MWSDEVKRRFGILKVLLEFYTPFLRVSKFFIIRVPDFERILIR